MYYEGGAAVITGAAGGIGVALAAEAARRGLDHLVLTDVDQARLDAVTADAQRAVRITRVAGDITDPDLDQRIDHAVELGGHPLRVVVNNAGIEHREAFADHALDAWHRVLDVNLTAAFRLTQHLLPRLIDSCGSIVNISSVAVAGFARQAAYDASKGGLSTLTRSMAVELGRHSIRANAVCPGFIDTPMLDAELRTIAENSSRTVPLRRMGTPAEVAEAALWLASEHAGYVTGQCLHVDGGWVRP